MKKTVLFVVQVLMVFNVFLFSTITVQSQWLVGTGGYLYSNFKKVGTGSSVNSAAVLSVSSWAGDLTNVAGAYKFTVGIGNGADGSHPGLYFNTTPANGFFRSLSVINGTQDLQFNRMTPNGAVNIDMVISSGGNIGLGTSAPGQRLDVNGSIHTNGYIYLENGGTIWANGTLQLSGTGTLSLLNQTGVLISKAAYPASATSGNLTVEGIVKIGTVGTTPAGYKLYVDNGILTEKVRVAIQGTAQWSDYVFEDGYKMLSLAELEAFVRRNKHLPGIPSAGEMVKNGNDLGATDARLLEKIEELALYTIELSKSNAEMKQKLDAVTAQNLQIVKRMQELEKNSHK